MILPARLIVLPPERQKFDAYPIIDDDLIRRIRADIDFTTQEAVDMRHPVLSLRLRAVPNGPRANSDSL